MSKLTQITVDEGCEAARDRYAAMSVIEARFRFSFELQGFVASMVDREEWSLPVALQKVVGLVDLLAKANDI